MNYKIEFLPIAARQLRKLSPAVQKQLGKTIQQLSNNPRAANCKKLQGIDGWRARSGDYRVIYKIDDGVLLILVLALGHRREIYR